MMEFKWSKEEYDDILLETDTWSYAITGNKKAEQYINKFVDIVYTNIKPSDPMRSEGFFRSIINNLSFEDLVNYTAQEKSRLADLVLGVFLMRKGAKMPEFLRDLILKYSNWKYEENQLTSESDGNERMKYLLEFQEVIKYYQEGQPPKISVEYLSDLIREKMINVDFTLLERTPIDYSL